MRSLKKGRRVQSFHVLGHVISSDPFVQEEGGDCFPCILFEHEKKMRSIKESSWAVGSKAQSLPYFIPTRLMLRLQPTIHSFVRSCIFSHEEKNKWNEKYFNLFAGI